MIRSKSSASSKAVLLLAGLLAQSPAEAVELGEGVQAHGFFSQSLAYTSDNNFGGASDDGVTSDLREIGANLSWRPDADWLVSGQVLARWAGKSDEGDPRLDYGYLDRRLLADGDTAVGVRMGKIKNPYGFFNTTRDVAHTRPGIIMPQSIYLDRIRNFFLAAPGVALYGNHASGDLDVSWTLGTMRFDADSEDIEGLFLTRSTPGRFKSRNSWLGQAMGEWDGGLWRLGLTLGEVKMRYDPAPPPTPDFGAGHTTTRPWVLSLEHNSEHLTLTAEYSEVTVNGQGYGLPVIDDRNTTQSWYLQATYRPTTDWSFYVRRDEVYLDKHDKEGRLGSLASGGQVPPHAFYARDWTLGARYDREAWSFMAEVHRVDGTVWLSPLDAPLNTQTGRWDLLLLQAAWRF